MNPPRPLRGALAAALIVVLAAAGACRRAARTEPRPKPAFAPFNFQIEVGADHYNIEGFIAHAGSGRLPALLVLTAGEGDARRCIEHGAGLVAMGMLEA